MKKNLIIAVAVAGLMASCTKSKTETEKIENPDGSTTTITTTETTSGIVDSAKINDAKNKIDEKADEVKEKKLQELELKDIFGH